MKEQKKWKPRIRNILSDGTEVSDLSDHVIPKGHNYYNIIKKINAEKKGIA